MAKKKKARRKGTKGARNAANGQERGNKSQAIRDYLLAHKNAMPKEIVAALKEQGVEVSPNMASMVKAKMKIRKARRQAKRATADHDANAATKNSDSAALDSALTLYKAARGLEVPPAKVRQAFLMLVESFG